MRILLLWLGFVLTIHSFAIVSENDSIHVEDLRVDAIMLAREGNLIESFEKIEFAIAKAKSVGLTDFFINKRLRIILANRYSNIGDFDRAIELTKSLESFFKQNGNLYSELYVKNNLGVYNQNIGRFAIAHDYFLEGWRLQKDTDETVDKLDWLDGLSASCIELGRFDEAKMYLEEAGNLLEVYNSDWKDDLLLYYYINQSNYHLAISDNTQAKKFLLKCVSLSDKTEDRKIADAYQLLSGLLFKEGKYQQALDYAKKMVILLGADKDTLAKDPYLLQSYTLQAKACLALKNYKEALSNCKKGDSQAFFFQQWYMFNESKFHIGELRRENLETGITALYYLFKQSGKVEYLEQALIYTNRAKSNVLNERLVSSNMLFLDERKDAISLRLKLVFELNELEKKKGNTKIIEIRNTLDSLDKVLGVKNQTPFMVKDLKAFQSSLKKESICLEYMIIDTLLFRFDIQKNTIGWNAENWSNPGVIFNFYNVLRNQNSTSKEYKIASSKLPVLLPYHLLNGSSIKEISIIPDGVLNYLVFEAISSSVEGEGWKSIHYLVEDYVFSYQFSIQSSRQKLDKAVNSYLGFAPDYSKLKEWATLKNNIKALEQAKAFFGGTLNFGLQATKKKFQEQSSNADILHLYAHGVSNDSSYDASYIMLQDEELHIDEVLALPLKARLCLLTACEVGLGKEYKGEGITSIAWAFKAAGVENVVQSMWKLKEQSSYQLINYFFENLANETNSSKALTNAKRQYINSLDIPERMKHPYYWAGIAHYGDGAVFTKSVQNWWKYILVGSLILGGSLILIKYIRKKSRVSK